MEKNQSSFPKAVCEKIFKAITFGPAFGKIRRISSRQPPKPKEGSEVPIKFDYSTRLPTPPTEKPKPTALNGSTQNNGRVPLASKVQQAEKPKTIVPGNGEQAQNNSKPKAEKGNGQIQVQFEHQAKKEEGMDDSFSSFIRQTRNRIMPPNQDSGENSGHGHGHGGIGKDHHFSNYIDQTKRKIRTTWSRKERSPSFFK